MTIDNLEETYVPPRRMEDEIGLKITVPFTVAAVGDLIMPAPLLRSDRRFTALVDRIREADVGFANMETSLVDTRHFQGPVTGTASPPSVGQAIKDMGVTLMSRANNHTFDCGVLGMIETDERLDALGIVHAGTGMNLQEARKARHQETPKGRVGLVSMYSLADTGHFGPTYARTEAGTRIGSMGGAPGINPLHLTAYNVVAPDDLARLREIARNAYGEREGASVGGDGKTPERFRFFDQWYEAGDDPGALHYEMDSKDRSEILAAIRSGKIYSDYLIATIHSHQATRFDPKGAFGHVQGLKEPLEHDAPDFLVRLAHESIDAGADMFVTHGVHTIAGVEIYKGRPVFYGLSNFVFQFGLQVGAGYDVMANYEKKSELGSAASHQAVLAITRYDAGELKEVRLYPADLGGPLRPISQMGIPMEPTPDVAERILTDVQHYSARFGTAIAIENGVGVIRRPIGGWVG